VNVATSLSLEVIGTYEWGLLFEGCSDCITRRLSMRGADASTYIPMVEQGSMHHMTSTDGVDREIPHGFRPSF